MIDFFHCRVCNKELPTALVKIAMREIAPQCCSPECRTVEIKKTYACCDKATFIPCVCMYSFTCPDHGDRHIGTHD